MTGINWGLAQGGQFQNALGMVMQMGREARVAKQQNALLEQRQQELDIRAQENEAKALEQQRKAQMEQMGIFRQLLKQAGENPQQAFAAAQQLDIDLSAVPPPNSPDFEPWRQRQLFILNALEKEGDNLPGLAREVILALPEDQRDPNGQPFRQAFTAALENKYAAEYVDGQGNTRRRAIIGSSQQQAQQTTVLPMSARPDGMSDDQLFEQARKAVEAGANVDDVFRQLREWGVEVN